MKIHLKVKFRAFGITFSTVEQTFDPKTYGFEIPILVGKRTIYNDRGILLELV